jgi:hypothetical protein
MMNWQPIETAPKDRVILLYYPGSEYINPIMSTGEYYASVKGSYWSCHIPWMGIRWMKKNQPTHWCELEGPTK